MLARDSVDEAMWRALQRKVRSLGAALDGKQKAQLQAAHTNWQAGGASATACSSSPDGAPYDVDNAAGGDAAASAQAPTGAGASMTVGAEDNGDDAASLMEERARREHEARRARQRSAFGDLFACGKRAAGTSGGTGGGVGGGVGGGGGGSCGAGSSQQVIDLSGDDDEPVTATSRGPTNVVAADVATADVAVAVAEMSDERGWFAVSSLTGRLHAFGLADVPQHGAANALPLAVQDEDETALPAVFTEPSVLRAARRWLFEWGELTPAQKVPRPAINTEPPNVTDPLTLTLTLTPHAHTNPRPSRSH